MSSQKGARSKLADVLADIKNSRGEDEYDYNNHETTPVPAKRRNAVNYVALSGHTPRQSRSSSTSQTPHTNNHEPKTPNSLTNSTRPRTRTCILKIFDRSLDLAQLCTDNTKQDVPLYPICRAWIRGYKSGQSSSNNSKSPTRQQADSNDKERSESPGQDNYVESADEVKSMPIPKPKKEAIEQFQLDVDNEEIDLRIPQTVQKFKPPKNLEQAIDKSISSMNRQECMDLNKKRWKQIRRDWSEARKIHEWRYEDSFKVLNDTLITNQR